MADHERARVVIKMRRDSGNNVGQRGDDCSADNHAPLRFPLLNEKQNRGDGNREQIKIFGYEDYGKIHVYILIVTLFDAV